MTIAPRRQGKVENFCNEQLVYQPKHLADNFIVELQA
jgi:hypothetical protein